MSRLEWWFNNNTLNKVSLSSLRQLANQQWRVLKAREINSRQHLKGREEAQQKIKYSKIKTRMVKMLLREEPTLMRAPHTNRLPWSINNSSNWASRIRCLRKFNLNCTLTTTFKIMGSNRRRRGLVPLYLPPWTSHTYSHRGRVSCATLWECHRVLLLRGIRTFPCLTPRCSNSSNNCRRRRRPSNTAARMPALDRVK